MAGVLDFMMMEELTQPHNGGRWLSEPFTADEAAPMASPYGTGNNTLVLVQTNGGLFKSGGVLNFPAASPDAWGGIAAYTNAVYGRKCGRTVAVDLNYSVLGSGGKGHLFGFFKPSSPQTLGTADALWMVNTSTNTLLNLFPGSALLCNIVQGTVYRVAVQLTTYGVRVFIKGGAFTSWTLLWTHVEALESQKRVRAGAFNRGAVITHDNLSTGDMGGVFASDYGFVTLNKPAPTAGTIYTGAADSIFEAALTAPSPLGDVAQLRYRQVDADNYHVLECTAAGAYRAYKVVAGTPTEYGTPVNVASVWAAGATVVVKAIADGTALNFYSQSATAVTKRGTAITDTAFQTATGTSVLLGAGHSAANVRVWPRRLPAFAALDSF